MFKDENRHYSLRKLSVGLASVLIGISFASTTGNSVKADMVNGSNDAQTVVKGSDTVIKIDAKSAPKEQSQIPKDVKKDSGAITQNSKQDAVNTEVTQQNAAIQGNSTVGDKALKANNSSVVQEDNNTKGDSLTDKSNALKVKAETAKKAVAAAFRPDSSETTLNLKSVKFIDPKTLNENKAEAVVNADSARGIDPVKFASNGGFDPKIWGTMDTSKWQLDNNGNITGYTGDMSHIIIPNASDFAKAGKNYQQISISSDEMRKLGSKSNAKANTLAISLTDDKKVNASNAYWNRVFNGSTLKQANLEGLDTGKVIDMSVMFYNASNLKSLDVSSWDTSKATNMRNMFNYAFGLTSLNVSKWDTSNVINMSGMFSSASGLTSLDVSNWNTSNVTDMSYMFSNASGLTSLDVSQWDTGKVTNMSWMFYYASGLTSLDLSNWNTGKVTNMSDMFSGASGLTSLDVSNWNTGNVTNMSNMFSSASGLTSLDVSQWDTGKVTNMSWMFYYASGLTSLDLSNWNTGKVTNISSMFENANHLTSLDVSNWDTSKVTNMRDMFIDALSLALVANSGKFVDHLVNHDNFADSGINSSVKSVTTDNAKLLQLLTNDVQHNSATRTIVFTFPTGYNPDLTIYHLIRVGNTYQIKQSADYDKPYLQGTVLINATEDVTKHHIDTTKKNKLSDTWQPNYDKLVLAHKNADGSVSFDAIQLPRVPGYKAVVKTVTNPANPTNALFAVNFMALPKPVTPALNDVKPAETFSPATPVAIEVAKPIKTEPKVTISATPKAIDLSNNTIAITPKTIDLSDNTVATTPKEAIWHVANEPERDTYRVSNGKYTVELPHINNTQLNILANNSTKDSVLFTYKGQNTKYVFNIKFANGHYLLTTYEIKSGKLVKLIDYNFIKSSKMSDVILDWLKLK